jgi:hypothetical protein
VLAITGVWWDLPSVTAQPARVPFLFVVDPPIAAARAAAAGTVEQCALGPNGPVRLLEERVGAGADALVVSHRNGLAAAGGDVLRLEAHASAEAEWILTGGVDAHPDVPATVRLRTRTAYAHGAGTPVQLMAVGPVTPVGTLERDAVAGDQTVFVSTPPALVSGAMVRISGGAAAPEFHRVTRLPSTPDLVNFFHQPVIDADGSFTLPPLGRLAQLAVLARLPGYPDVTLDFAPDYTGANDLTLVFRT